MQTCFADQVAKVGAKSVSTLLDAVRAAQGWPLKLIEENAKINQTSVDANQVGLLKRLASDGAIKPPFLKTTYSGEKSFYVYANASDGVAAHPSKTGHIRKRYGHRICH